MVHANVIQYFKVLFTVFVLTVPLFLDSGTNTATEDKSGKDAVLFHTNYSRWRHPFPIYIVAYNTTYRAVST